MIMSAEAKYEEAEVKDEKIIDPDARDTTVAPVVYDITSYGVDYDVEGLVKRLQRGDIVIPDFQRDYVWSLTEASRLVESMLLGLPIPGIFLAKDSDTNRLLVIDGQQRLKSLQFFYSGEFNPKPEKKSSRKFKLKKVQARFEGLMYHELESNDRRSLDDSIIHATIIKQETPSEDNTSIYHVFERLNTGGRKLTAQEIRVAIYMGALNKLIVDLNDYGRWRELFGPKHSRLKDQELILRFFAFYFNKEGYIKPIKEFLNKFNQKYRNLSEEKYLEWGSVFKATIDFVYDNGGRPVFRPDRVFNTNVFESVMYVVAKKLQNDPESLKGVSLFKKLQPLFENRDFIESVTRATTDESSMEARHKFVEEALS
jgi:uncharacterized protein with ParB-like and HNH nuclease domain